MRKLSRCLSLAALALGLAAATLTPARAAADLKVLTVPRTGQFDTLDPPQQFNDITDQLMRQVYSSLLTYAYLERPYKLAPDLLAQMPELAADKVTYTFRLRQGIRFHDNPCFKDGKGREVVADDVLYSLKRFADARLNSKSWFAMEGAVLGLDDFRAATAKAAPGTDATGLDVAGLHKIDKHTFTIKLTRENPLFLYALAMSPTAVVPIEAVQFYKERFGVNPVGTGPFTLKDIDRKGTLHLMKNPNYHGIYPSVGAPGDAALGLLKDAGKKLPLVDLVEMPLIEEAQPAALKFLKGEIDLRGLDRANFTKIVERTGDGGFRLKDEFAPKFNIYWVPAISLTYQGINMKDPLLGGNKKLRQALAHLMDTRGLIDTLQNGRGRKLQSIVPFELAGGEQDTGASFHEYDLAKAKQLLTEAGYPAAKGLPPITVSYHLSDAETRDHFDFAKARFAAGGVQLKAAFMDTPAFSKATEGGNFQIYDYGWVADFPDAENFYQLLYSKNVAPGPNLPTFSNPVYDRAYEASRHMASGPQRNEHFKTMNALIKDEVPIIIGVNPLRFGILQKWVSNHKRNLLVPGAEFAFVDVDMVRKKKGL